jgi:AbrB family looped-hinge helix DNA binding protein
MPKKKVGPKGKVVIPKRMRDTLGLKPGVEVILEMRDQKIVIKKPQDRGSYTEYFTTTSSPKLKKPVNIKQIILPRGRRKTCPTLMQTFSFIQYARVKQSSATMKTLTKFQKLKEYRLGKAHAYNFF